MHMPAQGMAPACHLRRRLCWGALLAFGRRLGLLDHGPHAGDDLLLQVHAGGLQSIGHSILAELLRRPICCTSMYSVAKVASAQGCTVTSTARFCQPLHVGDSGCSSRSQAERSSTWSTVSGSAAAGQPAVMTQPGRCSLAVHTSSAQCGATGATSSVDTWDEHRLIVQSPAAVSAAECWAGYR